MKLNVLLYDDYTALDAFGPVEVLSKLPECEIRYFSVNGGIVTNKQDMQVVTEPLGGLLLEATAERPAGSGEADAQSSEDPLAGKSVLLLPGGPGSRVSVSDDVFIVALAEAMEFSDYVLTVCTGSALAAKTGLLNGVHATSNKMAFDWVVSNGPAVLWEKEPRWVADGKYYTSAGISAGIDMAFGFVRDFYGEELARKISLILEYDLK